MLHAISSAPTAPLLIPFGFVEGCQMPRSALVWDWLGVLGSSRPHGYSLVDTLRVKRERGISIPVECSLLCVPSPVNF